GFDQARTSVESFQSAAATASSGTNTFYRGLAEGTEYSGGAERGIRRVEMAMASLASTSLGATHPVGQLAEGLLLFGTGSTITITVLAALTAIGLALKTMQDGFDESAKGAAELEKALATLGPHAKLVGAEINLAMLESAQGTFQSVEKMGLWKSTATFLNEFFKETMGEDIISRVKRAAAATQEIADIAGRPDIARAQEAVTLAQRKFNEELEKTDEF